MKSKLPTPKLPFKRKDYDLVYEPAEDSFLVLDALELDADLINCLAPLYILEIGPGFTMDD